MRASIERTLERMVQSIVRRFAPERVILFGSHASGCAGADSDLDLLLVMTPCRSKAQQEPNHIELVINMKTAKAMGIRFPQSILLRADRVIE